MHYYNLKASLSQPQMLVVPDHTDPLLPVPDDLLVNLSESRSVVDTLLESLAQVSRVRLCVCTWGVVESLWGKEGRSRLFSFWRWC